MNRPYHLTVDRAHLFALLAGDRTAEMIRRADGRLEWACSHGVGHTVAVPAVVADQDAWWAHGCDGCCGRLLREGLTTLGYVEDEGAEADCGS